MDEIFLIQHKCDVSRFKFIKSKYDRVIDTHMKTLNQIVNDLLEVVQ